MAKIRPVTIAVLALAALLFTSTVEAQSASMPLPPLVAKDADGKVFAPVYGVAGNPLMHLNFNGDLVGVWLREFGPTQSFWVYFAIPGCQGSAFISSGDSNKPFIQGGEQNFGHETMYAIVGPDPDLGTYRLYRQTDDPPVQVTVASSWYLGQCNASSLTADFYQTELVTPNPLEGFHGPTTLHPERTWTVDGGTKITPPSP